MSEKISKIQVMGEIYELADYSLLEVIQNEGKYLKIENNTIVAADLPTMTAQEQHYPVMVGDTGYESV